MKKYYNLVKNIFEVKREFIKRKKLQIVSGSFNTYLTQTIFNTII